VLYNALGKHKIWIAILRYVLQANLEFYKHYI